MAQAAPGMAPPLVADERWAVSIDEAAERLGIGRTLMFEAAKRGDFPTIKIGGRRVISMSVINDWLVNGYAPKGEED
jgi:excisionase family DNA binding protein